MLIRYVFARPGIAATDYIIAEIAACLRSDQDKPLFLMVPEQFTLESEKRLIKGIGEAGIIQVEVLSFERLAYKVLNEAGGRTCNTLNEQGKSMILRKILEEITPQLITFASAARQTGFINIISDCLSDFKINSIDADSLAQQIENMPEDRHLLTGKLKDLLLIYRSFDQYLQDRYIDPEDYINLVTAKLPQTSLLNNARIWIDGIDSFSPQLLKMLAGIARLSESVTIALAMGFGGDDRDGEIFSVSRRTYNQLHALALELGMTEEIVTPKPDETREPLKPPALIFLEKELFAYPYSQYEGEPLGLQVFAAANCQSEIENITAAILTLVREKQYRFRDIMIACTDMERYGSLIRHAFRANHIPYFMDEKRGIINNPIIESILASLQIISKGYRYEEVFRLIKTGFSNLDNLIGDELENYVLGYGIRGTLWKKPFTIGNGLDLDRLNEVREIFIKPLESLERSLKETRTCREMAEALYEYLETMGMQAKITAYINELREQKLLAYVNENTQIWNIVMVILDQIVEFLGDEPSDLKKFTALLEAGFASCEIGIIPTAIDEITVGSISRSKRYGCRALFLIGANDDLLPPRPAAHQLLLPEEIEVLMGQGIDLGFDAQQRLDQENFRVYETMTKAGQYLWISYALADQEGKPLHQSIIVDRLQMIYPGLKIKQEKDLFAYQNLDMIGTPDGTLEALILNLKDHLKGDEIDPHWWEVYEWYYRQAQWKDRLQAILSGFDHRNQQDRIAESLAEKLYDLPLRASISRLERFNGCQFAHFVQYGLKPQQRMVYSVGAPDIGELFHLGLVSFARHLKNQRREWKSLSQKECFELINMIMDQLVTDYKDGILNSSPRYQYLVQRLKRICRRAVWTLAKHLQKGDFVPAFYEVSFGKRGLLPPIEIELESGEKVYLEGRIDRVDIWEDSDSAYVKVIDYKSGFKNIDLSDIYNGFSLQLIIYLYSVLQAMPGLKGKTAKPAGMFYFKIDDPLVKNDSRDPEVIEKAILKELKMSGLVLKDINVIRRMERDISGYSEILPVQVMRGESVSERSNALGEKEFDALISHVGELVKQYSQAILEGAIRIEPSRSGQETACKYCQYRSVCQFDILFADNRYRYIKNLKKEEILRKLTVSGEVNDNG